MIGEICYIVPVDDVATPPSTRFPYILTKDNAVIIEVEIKDVRYVVKVQINPKEFYSTFNLEGVHIRSKVEREWVQQESWKWATKHHDDNARHCKRIYTQKGWYRIRGQL